LHSAIKQLFQKPHLRFTYLDTEPGGFALRSESQLAPIHCAGNRAFSNLGSTVSSSYNSLNNPSSLNYTRSSISARMRHEGVRFEGGRSFQNGLRTFSRSGENSDNVSFTSNVGSSNFHHLQLAETHRLNQNEDKDSSTDMTGPVVRNNVPFKFPKLELILQADKVSKEFTNFIGLMFKKIDPSVKVYPGRKTDEYIWKFQGTSIAKEAFLKGQQMGLKMKRWFPARPSPSKPTKYISLERLLIKEGKSESKKIVGWLNKGAKVTVNQLKGKRARLIKPNKEVIGWVSMYSNEDLPLLEQVNEIEDRISNNIDAMFFGERVQWL